MPRIEPAELTDWITNVLTAVDAPAEIARVVARSLVSADSRGHSSHGVRLLPKYLDRISSCEQNRIDPTARPTTEKRAGPRVLVDGNDAFGRVVGSDATAIAVELANEYGVGAVGIRDGNHLGRMGEWAEMAADEGVLTLAFVKAEASLVAPAGSADRRLSTNPIAAGIPTFDSLAFPIVLDMATSVVAGGNIWEHHRAGEPLPDGWIVDDGGEGTIDTGPFVDGAGALRPLGGTVAGHKGFGLAVVAELVGSLLGNGVVAGEATTFTSTTPSAWSPSTRRGSRQRRPLRRASGDSSSIPAKPVRRLDRPQVRPRQPLMERFSSLGRRNTDQSGLPGSQVSTCQLKPSPT